VTKPVTLKQQTHNGPQRTHFCWQISARTLKQPLILPVLVLLAIEFEHELPLQIARLKMSKRRRCGIPQNLD
jgi:hypothetical protein